MLTKAMLVLRSLREAETGGLQAGELVQATGMHRATLHRLLRSLTQERLVEQDADRCYHLGTEAWLLGMAANRRFDLKALAGLALERIEAETHDTIYLLRRVEDEVLCIARCDGSYPIKSLVMEVGKAYPLGVGGGGLAVLASLPEAEGGAVMQRIRPRLSAYPRVNVARIRQLLKDARRQGFAFWPALISEAFVVAVPIFDQHMRPVGALSCAAIKERLDVRRRSRVAALLQAEASRIQLRMSGGRPAPQ